MLIFLLFFLSGGMLIAPVAPLQMDRFAAPFHEACLAITEREKLTSLSKLLLCNDSEARRQFLAESKSSGTYYLLLFSSFHVLMIEELCEMSTSHRRLSRVAAWILNIFFLLIAGAPLRLMRSFLGLLIQRSQKIWALNWTTLQVISLSGLLLLPMAIANREQLSLLLGWTASLAARCFSQTTSFRTRFQTHLRIYVILAPCLLPLALPHPISVLVTFAFSALLPWLTLPAALIEFACPPCHSLIQTLEVGLETGLHLLDQTLPVPFAPCAVSVSILFVYVAALTICAEWHRRHSLRSSADEAEPELLL